MLVEGGYFSTVNVCFLVKGHTKNSCDRNFNSMKQHYHKKNAHTKEQALTRLSKSNNVTMIGVDSAFFLNIDSIQKDLCKKYPSSTISKGHLFIVDSSAPTSVTVKASAAAYEEAVYELAKGSKKGQKYSSYRYARMP